MGAVYLAVVERMKASFNYALRIIAVGNVRLLVIYLINKALDTNFIYLMKAPDGTVIKAFENIFGWPGYVFAMDAFVVVFMLLMLLVSKAYLL